jgi:hypothetical protein
MKRLCCLDIWSKLVLGVGNERGQKRHRVDNEGLW